MSASARAPKLTDRRFPTEEDAARAYASQAGVRGGCASRFARGLRERGILVPAASGLWALSSPPPPRPRLAQEVRTRGSPATRRGARRRRGRRSGSWRRSTLERAEAVLREARSALLAPVRPLFSEHVDAKEPNR